MSGGARPCQDGTTRGWLRLVGVMAVTSMSTSAPRAMAATPVRDTSTRPRANIKLMKASIFGVSPVSSKTKLSKVLSSARARNVSAMRRASIRNFYNSIR